MLCLDRFAKQFNSFKPGDVIKHCPISLFCVSLYKAKGACTLVVDNIFKICLVSEPLLHNLCLVTSQYVLSFYKFLII